VAREWLPLVTFNLGLLRSQHESASLREEVRMFVAKRVFIAVGVLVSVVLAVPVSADEFTDALALLKRAMAGHWSGQLTGTDNTGQKFEEEDAFTYVVTSEDSLDSATWSAGSLEIATYEGDGRYVLRSWNRAGRQSETPLRARIADEPDAAGAASRRR
jgi:hypothetical protein